MSTDDVDTGRLALWSVYLGASAACAVGAAAVVSAWAAGMSPALALCVGLLAAAAAAFPLMASVAAAFGVGLRVLRW